MPRRGADERTLDLFAAAQARDAQTHLPNALSDQRRFPTNLGAQKVALPVEDDLLASREPLIITGFAALDRLIQFCGEAGQPDLRVLLGHEPYAVEGRSYRLDGADFPKEVETFWLQHNISLLHSAALLHTIKLLESGRVRARYVHGGVRLHAKVFIGDDAATLGSSNFTDPGMDRQHEANARFERGKEPRRYAELKQLAENYWAIGRDYNAELIALLKKLLRFVTWPEALARACAEMLEGEWAEAYLRGNYLSDADTLWPSQRQGIAQALTVLSQHDSVLIADATGAGKTRMGAYLIGAIRDHILRRGRMRNSGNTVMVCPPSVLENWNAEKIMAGVPMEVYSHGGLSHKKSSGHEIKAEALRRAQVLCVDEGHNFLNLGTTRTQMLLRNMADHVVMLTATPINRSVTDLLRIADVLGADNLEPSTLAAFEKMLGVRRLSRTLSEQEAGLLRGEIRKFTVRRTKVMLNRLIEREPERYTDKNGQRCRFPRHKPRVYTLDEPAADRELAARIRMLAEKLHGVSHFEHPLELPLVLKQQGVSPEQFLKGRLQGAKKLVQYLIRSALRSSRAALVEHVEGTAAAIKAFDIQGFRKSKGGGDMLSRLEGLAGKPPRNKLGIDLPDWLSDPAAHKRACEQDALLYRRIAELCRQMSAQREIRKAAQLLSLRQHHAMILAFDSRPITLAVIRDQLQRIGKAKIMMGWGEDEAARRTLIRSFAPDSEESDVIGLCSDALAEGVNLQSASALLHLDMPTVVRVAEQRAGRVDRLDTVHPEIEVWWPQDAEEFQLTSDEKFVQRYETVESLLGANMPLPAHMKSRAQSVSVEQMIEEYEASAAQPWDGLEDAFSPVRGLVEGDQALVSEATYQAYRKVTERVLSHVSLVQAHSPWAFFCLTAGAFDAPRWLLMPSYNGEVTRDLLEVVLQLRERLTPDTQNLNGVEAGAAVLERFLKQLVKVERKLLSQKKQRALDELDYCLTRLLKQGDFEHAQTALQTLLELKSLLRNPQPDKQPDWDALATRWLDLIRPVWFEKLGATRRRRPLLLKDLRADLLGKPDWLQQQLLEHFQRMRLLPSLDTRIRACIVGVA